MHTRKEMVPVKDGTHAETRNEVGKSMNREILKTTKDHYGALRVSSEFGRHRANGTGGCGATEIGGEAREAHRMVVLAGAAIIQTGVYFCVIHDGHGFLLLADTALLLTSDVSIADVPLEINIAIRSYLGPGSCVHDQNHVLSLFAPRVF
jgi:hypothetical protein